MATGGPQPEAAVREVTSIGQKLAARGQLLRGLTPLMDARTNHNLFRNDQLSSRRTLLLWVE